MNSQRARERTRVNCRHRQGCELVNKPVRLPVTLGGELDAGQSSGQSSPDGGRVAVPDEQHGRRFRRQSWAGLSDWMRIFNTPLTSVDHKTYSA